MARALEPESSEYETELFTDPNLGLGRVTPRALHRTNQPVWNAERTCCLVMTGDIFDATAPRAALAAKGAVLGTDSREELLLCLYEVFGEGFARHLNGAFVAVIWDGRTRKLTIVNDRLGLVPIYYARLKDALLFSTGVRALLADPELSRATDPLAIAQFLMFDHLLDDRTLLSAVRLLPQASALSFSDGNLSVRPYWRLEYPDACEPRPERGLREELCERLRQAVGRQAEGSAGEDMGLLLSGGLDSRLLLAYLCDFLEPSKLHTFTWGIPGCDDARISRKLSRLAGTSHHFHTLEPDFLLRKAWDAVRITDGHANLVNLHALAILDHVSQRVTAVHKGFLGDAMFGFALQRPMWADYDPADSRRVHLGVHDYQGVLNYTSEGLIELGTDSFNHALGTSLLDSYWEAMMRSGNRQLASQRLYFDLTQRVPRMTLNGVEVVRSRLDVRLPFADADLLDFSLSLPPGYLFERYLVRSVFSESFPRYSKVPVSDTGLPMISCASDIVLRARKMVRWHLNNSRFPWLSLPERRPYKDYRTWFRTVLRSWVEETLLAPSSLQRGYFKPGAIKRLVSDHLEGRVDHTVRLGALLSLEIWHRQFLD